MKSAVLPNNEQARLDALRRYNILDTEPEQSYDDLTLLASYICQTSIALITFVDKDRQWFKSRIGLQTTETSRDISFCSHAILQPELFIVPDTFQDDRFSDNPLVLESPHIRFYAAAPLKSFDGFALGTLCVIDHLPHTFTNEQQKMLWALSRQVSTLIEYRSVAFELGEALTTIKLLEGVIPICAWCKKIRDEQGKWTVLERYFQEHTDSTFTHGICPECAKTHYQG